MKIEPKDSSDPIGQIEGQLRAMRSMLFALICACDAETPGIAETTIEVAKQQRDSALSRGLPMTAMMIGDMIRSLEEVFPDTSADAD